MEKITEKILWNDILALMDKYKHYFMIKTVDELKGIRLKFDTDDEDGFRLMVSTNTNALPSAEVMTIMAIIMIKYHPDIEVKLYRVSRDILFNEFMGMRTDRFLMEFNLLETFGIFMTTSLCIIQSIALRNADEDLIKYAVPRLDKIMVDRWIKFCDELSLLESKALILRYANHNDDMKDMIL